MLPPLFGVSWGMYAVIGAIVLLLIVLLVLVAQRKKKAGLSAPAKTGAAGKAASNKHPNKVDKAARYAELRQARAGDSTSPAPPRGSYPGRPADLLQSLPQEPLPPAGYVPAAMPPALAAVPAPRVHSVPIEEILPGTDPLHAIIFELLSGWGDLTQDDTNRLAVFRPDRVQAAVATTDIPRELKSSEHARARLAQLRRWASGLEPSAPRSEPSPAAPRAEYAGIGTMQPAMPAPARPAQMMPTMPAIAAATVVATQPLVAAMSPAAAPAPAQVPSFGQPFAWQPESAPTPVEVAPAPAPVMSAAGTPLAVPPPPTPEMIPQPTPAPAPAPVAAAVETPWRSDMAEASRSTEAAIAAAAAAFWARPELGGTLPDTTPAAPQTQPLAPPQPPAPLPLGQDLPTLVLSTPIVEAPSIAPLQSASPFAPMPTGDSDTFLEDLGSRVSTAEALLALPPTEQPGLLAFLRPSELARVLQATGDSELKKTVIDTLESVGSPSALDIIYRCLDDPDPQIQAKALESADRLLGAQ